MKTVRFSELVRKCGQPESYVLWTAPAKDPEFKRAIEKNRVLTVHQENRSGKKDYGVVGFTKDPHAELLIFPKSLQRFAGKRAVGLRYELLKTSGEKKSTHREKAKRFAVFHSATVTGAKSDDRQPPETPEEEKKTPTALRKSRHPHPVRASAKPREPARKSPSALAREVRRALTELKKGKSIAAYQRLEKALEESQQTEK